VFNERIDGFTGTSPLRGSLYIQTGNTLIHTLYTPDKTISGNVYKVDQDQDIIKFFGEETTNVFSFIVNGAKEEESAAMYEKIFSSLRINAPEINLILIDYETEYQKGRWNFKKGKEHDAAEYIEGDWNIPLVRDKEKNNDVYGQGSEFRGRWLKVTLAYKGNKEMYIRSLLTEFDISYA
jgi:hypothetical protein